MRSPRTATKSSPRSPQLEKACAQQRRPKAAKNKNKLKKKNVVAEREFCFSCQGRGLSWQLGNLSPPPVEASPSCLHAPGGCCWSPGGEGGRGNCLIILLIVFSDLVWKGVIVYSHTVLSYVLFCVSLKFFFSLIILSPLPSPYHMQNLKSSKKIATLLYF